MLAVKAENIGKKYIIGHRSSEYARFNEYLTGLGKGILRRLRNPFKPYDVSLDLEDFWALRNISFELKQGDRIGIIGHNGSGKSTLLKILSRITVPTEGRISIRGRTASLLEVGTGFHPELTGRENIFLNGSILGMTRSEIKKKFDEIVDFSGVEKFLDTPVKRYSSGMYVRLAFAVAAHLEPEVLIVDEVLAVGDAEFQKKCLGKMKDITSDGDRTILFVSHNLSAVQTLCNRGIVLQQGEMLYDGDAAGAIRTYTESNQKSFAVPLAERRGPSSEDGRVHFTQCVLKNISGEEVSSVQLGAGAVFEVEFECREEMRGDIQLTLAIRREGNPCMISLNTRNLGILSHFRKGTNRFRFTLPRVPLYPGTYYAHLYAEKDNCMMTYIQDAFSFRVIDGSFQNRDILSFPYHAQVAVDYSIEPI